MILDNDVSVCHNSMPHSLEHFCYAIQIVKFRASTENLKRILLIYISAYFYPFISIRIFSYICVIYGTQMF